MNRTTWSFPGIRKSTAAYTKRDNYLYLYVIFVLVCLPELPKIVFPAGLELILTPLRDNLLAQRHILTSKGAIQSDELINQGADSRHKYVFKLKSNTAAITALRHNSIPIHDKSRM